MLCFPPSRRALVLSNCIGKSMTQRMLEREFQAAEETRPARRVSSRFFHRKVAVLPNSTHDFRVLQSSALLSLMTKFSTKEFMRQCPLGVTDGMLTWLLGSGYIGSQQGADNIMVLDDLAPRHAQVTYQGDKYFLRACVESPPIYLKLPFDVGRREFPLSKGDVIEMGYAFAVTVLDLQVSTTKVVHAAHEKLPPRKDVRFSCVSDIRTQVVLRDLSKQTKLTPPPSTTLEPLKIELLLQQKDSPVPSRVVASTKSYLWFGSLHSADIIHPTLDRLHAKIEFVDGRYVLKDFCNATRVLVGDRPVQIVEEDVVVVGDRQLRLVKLQDHTLANPGMEIQVLRTTTRKRRHLYRHLPIQLELPPNKLLHVGRASHCSINLTNYAVKLVHFSILYEHCRVWVMPLHPMLNQGLYRLIHRRRYTSKREEIVHNQAVPVVSTVSPVEPLEQDSVFKIGCSEIEVVFVKNMPREVAPHMKELMNDRYTILQRLPWFLLSPNLPSYFNDMSHLASHCKVMTISAGEMIYSQGEDALRAYVVLQGSVLLFRSKGDDKFSVENVDRGGSFGEIALARPGSRHTTNAMARCNAVCMAILAKDWYDYCEHYRDMYLLPVQQGLHETPVLDALAALPGMELISPSLLKRVALKMTHRTFLPGTSLLHGGEFSIFFVVDGTVQCLFDDNAVESHSNPFCFDMQSHLVPSLVDIKTTETTQCLVLSAADYDNTIGMSLKHRHVDHPLAFITAFDMTPNQTSTLPVHRTSTMTLPKFKRKSSLMRAKELWTGVAVEDEEDEPKPAPVQPPTIDTNADSWRQKKRNADMLKSRIEFLQTDPAVESALVLYVLAGPNRGDVHVVRNTLSIGNTQGPCTMKLRDRAVSEQHAIIFHQNGKYWLQDCDSTTGTFVRLTDDKACCLRLGDVLHAGETEFTILGTPMPTTAMPSSKHSSCCIT
ncbi:hypothetical protein Ae201684P_008072 [Aphanomyces euteiches]|nr:hypothetical protein Ae201684P_008072 [Aphanomyces euteiches]